MHNWTLPIVYNEQFHFDESVFNSSLKFLRPYFNTIYIYFFGPFLRSVLVNNWVYMFVSFSFLVH